jgi:hypothetical protein
VKNEDDDDAKAESQAYSAIETPAAASSMALRALSLIVQVMALPRPIGCALAARSPRLQSAGIPRARR